MGLLQGIGLVSKSRTRSYRNAPVSNRYLVKGSHLLPNGDIVFFKHASTMWQNFSALDEVVRRGRPARHGFDHESFIMGMHNLTVFRTESLSKALGLKGVKTMLDLGGGPGTNAIAMAKKGVKSTVFDLPETIKIAKKVVSHRDKCEKGIRFIAGDFHMLTALDSGYNLRFLFCRAEYSIPFPQKGISHY